MKKLKRTVAMLMSLVMLLGTLVTSFAASEETIFNYSYSVIDNSFMDTFNVRNEDGSISKIVRVVTSDNVSTVRLESKEGVRIFKGQIDYEQMVSKGNAKSVMLRVNVHDDNIFNHDEFAHNTAEVTKDEGELSKDIIAAIISTHLGLPGVALNTLIDMVYSMQEDPRCYSMVVEEVIFEVTFKEDGTYYTHCHHLNVISKDVYGTILKESSYNLTYEQVGG